MIERTTIVRRSPRAVFRKLAEGSGAVLLNLDTSAYHGVNEVGAAIWELAEEDVAFADLVSGLRAQLDDPPDALERDVEEFVNDLVERDLLRLVTPEEG